MKKKSIIVFFIIVCCLTGCGGKKDYYVGVYDGPVTNLTQTLAIKKDGTMSLLITRGLSETWDGTWEEVEDGTLKLTFPKPEGDCEHYAVYIDENSFETKHDPEARTLDGFGGVFTRR